MSGRRSFPLLALLRLPAFQQPPQSNAEKDLALKFEISGDKTGGPGQGLNGSARLVNRSKDKVEK